MLIQAILKSKPPGFVSVTSDLPVSGVIDILAKKGIGAVLVVENGELIGILSERDVVRSLSRCAAQTLTLLAADLMTRKPITATPETTVEQAMEMMTEGHFRHLPIVEDGQLTGLVSIGDVVKARIDQSQHEVDTLRTYVSGSVLNA
ncbi:MAG: CBS domain-containing protein [Proteobacteria bacterium]|nr:CBS domain-containing protein [Pseudomonadota bacterium]MBU6425693.1 CBS domain-containing protein [Rhodospirillales bacterium]MDE2238832.1 CBS domain-containing protein [Rhodospirillales bacterium]